MTDTLDQLVRLHGWKLDETRRKVVELERLADHLRSQIEAIGEELARERVAAEQSIDLRRMFSGYVAQARQRRARIKASLRDVEGQIEAVREEVAEAYRELKKYEQARRSRMAVREAALRRREQILNDEIGLSMFRRRS